MFAIAGVVAWALMACTGENHGFTDAGSDATTSEGGRSCAANSDCDDQTACTQDLCLVGGHCSNEAIAGACDGGMCVSGMGCVSTSMTCSSNAECNDHVDCTMDACLVNGTCDHAVNDNLCPPGQRCTATGCAASCSGAADCDDHIDCTVDVCQSNGQCLHTAQNNRCTPPQVCIVGMGCSMPSSCGSDAQCDDHVYCNGAERCSAELACVAGMPVNCDDMDPCTMDACSEAMMGACTHMMDPACSMSVHSGIFNVSPAPSYSCAFGLYTLSVPMMQFTVSGTMLTVNGAPAPMMGTLAAGATMFDVSGTNPSGGGGCDEHYRLQGMFTDSMHWSGTFTARFTDPGVSTACDPLYECSDQSFMVTGTSM
jgi:hypothetical protein